MTKAEATAEFERTILRDLEQNSEYPDFSARRKLWADFVSSLYAQGLISSVQTASWQLPALVRGPRKEPPPPPPKRRYEQPPLFPELRR